MKSFGGRSLLFFFELSLHLQLYKLSSLILYGYMGIAAGSNSGERCLYGKKTVFQSDMMVIGDRLNLPILAIDRSYLRAIVHHFFERESNFHLPTENKLTTKPGNKLAYSEYCSSFFWPILNKLKVKIWVSCDFIYYYERPFQEQCEEQNIRSVVLMKECYKSPIQHMAWSYYLAKNFSDGIPAARIGVANKKMKDVLVSSGLSRSDAIEVIGSPRLEELATNVIPCRDSHGSSAGPLVIFFESGIRSGLPRFGVKSEVYEVLQDLNITMYGYERITELWEEIQQKILRDSLSLATENPDVEVIYKQKTGAAPPVLPDAAHRLRNWRRVVGGSNADLLTRARLCVAFNTSAILEALFSDVPVFSPPLSDLNKSELNPFLMDYGDSVKQYTQISELLPRIKLSGRSFALKNVYDSLASASDDGAFSAKVSWPRIQRVLGD